MAHHKVTDFPADPASWTSSFVAVCRNGEVEIVFNDEVGTRPVSNYVASRDKTASLVAKNSILHLPKMKSTRNIFPGDRIIVDKGQNGFLSTVSTEVPHPPLFFQGQQSRDGTSLLSPLNDHGLGQCEKAGQKPNAMVPPFIQSSFPVIAADEVQQILNDMGSMSSPSLLNFSNVIDPMGLTPPPVSVLAPQTQPSWCRLIPQQIEVVDHQGHVPMTRIKALCFSPPEPGLYKLINYEHPSVQPITFDSGAVFDMNVSQLQKSDGFQSTVTLFTERRLSSDCWFNLVPMVTDLACQICVAAPPNIENAISIQGNFDEGASMSGQVSTSFEIGGDTTNSLQREGTSPPQTYVVQEPLRKVKNQFSKIAVPIDAVQGLQVAEELLKSNPHFRKDVVAWLKTIGGKDLKNVLHRILDRIISKELQIQLNFKGQRGEKVAFEQFECFLEVIFEAVGATHPNMKWTQYDLERWCGAYLKQAPNKKKGVNRLIKQDNALPKRTKILKAKTKTHGSGSKDVKMSSSQDSPLLPPKESLSGHKEMNEMDIDCPFLDCDW